MKILTRAREAARRTFGIGKPNDKEAAPPPPEQLPVSQLQTPPTAGMKKPRKQTKQSW